VCACFSVLISTKEDIVKSAIQTRRKSHSNDSSNAMQ